MNSSPPLRLFLARCSGCWGGLARAEDGLAACATGRSREEALRYLRLSLPGGSASEIIDEVPAYETRALELLAALEEGEELPGGLIPPELRPSPSWFSPGSLRAYRLVAAIPRGYASSYGRVGEAAGIVAREVGRLMAHNPLYPLVPCHRIVGADYGLVGYRGATEGPDLEDKLARLRAEARGLKNEILIEAPPLREGEEGLGLFVFPVERVLARAEGEGVAEGQLELWAEELDIDPGRPAE